MNRIAKSGAIALLLAITSWLAPSHSHAQGVTRVCTEATGTNGSNNCTDVSPTNPFPVTGSFAASGFTPSISGARMTPFTVTTSDSSGTLPTGSVVVVSNVGTTNPMYCNVNGIAATTSDQLIEPGSWYAFTIPVGSTALHCIATGGSTTANGLGGSGIATGAGGGGGGGGSGSNASVGSTGAAVPGSATLSGTDNPSGNLTGLNSDVNGSLETTLGPDYPAVTGTITTADVGTTCSGLTDGQTVCTGTPTPGSFVEYTVHVPQQNFVVQSAIASGSPTVVYNTQISRDGINWYDRGLFLDSNAAPNEKNSISSPTFTGQTAGGGINYYRIRATSFSGGGSTTVTIEPGEAIANVYVGNLFGAATGTASVGAINVQGNGASALPINVSSTASGTTGATAPTVSTQAGATVLGGPLNPTTAPFYTNGTIHPIELDNDGNLRVEESDWASMSGSLSMAAVTPTFASSGSTISGLTAATFTAGSAVVFADSGGSLPAGVSVGTPYLIVTSSSTVATISTVSGVAVTWTGSGSGTQTAVQAYIVPISDSMTTEAAQITLSGGGTITPLVSPDGVNWTGTNWVSVVSGTLSNTFSATNTAKFAVAGWQYQAFYASTPAAGQTFSVNWDQSGGGSTVALTSPLPNGGNTIGNVTNTAVQSAPGTPQTTAFTIQGNASGVPVPISGLVTASFSQFAPNGNYAALSVGATSTNVALPAGGGTTIAVYNTGTTAAFVKLGTSSAVAATAGDDQVAPGGFLCFAIGSNTYLAGIETAGLTNLNISGGTGGCAGSGGGGGSSGASADTTLPATGTLSAADTASTSTTGTNGQTVLTWATVPTPGSTLQFGAFSGAQTGLLICYGTVSATMELDTEMDTATPPHYIQQTISQLIGGASPTKTSTFTGLIMGKVNLAGAVGAQVRATAYTSGSPTCTLRLSSNLADSVIANLLPPGKDQNINVTTTTTGTSLLNGVAGQTIHVSGYEFIAGGTTTFSLGYSTSTSCTSITTVAGPWPLGAQVGETFGDGVADIMTLPSGDTLCEVSTGSSVTVGGHVHTTQY